MKTDITFSVTEMEYILKAVIAAHNNAKEKYDILSAYYYRKTKDKIHKALNELGEAEAI